MKRLSLILAVLVTVLLPGTASRTGGVYFDDSDPSIIVLGNQEYYEIGFRKSNGAIAFIIDKSTGQPVTEGSRYECLWGAWSPNATPEYVGGCGYNAAWPNHFTFAWSPAERTLTLDYTPDPVASQKVTAQVKVVVSEEPWFDMHLWLQNDWGYTLYYVLFPSDLVFVENDIREALLPILPGVVLESGFFDQNRSYLTRYPGYPGVFADYVALSTDNGRIALYSLHDQGLIAPVDMGFLHDDAYITDSTYFSHTFGAAVNDGQAWATPWVRIRVSQPTIETVNAYRVDNGLHQYPSLRDKLGTLYTQVAQSPLLKADAQWLGIPFVQYPELLSKVPTSGILHPVGYQPGGHDENHPDFLPPDPVLGTTTDFANMFRQVQQMGFLVMPYTNPTFWDDESPTLQNLPQPLSVTDVAVLDYLGVPVYEYYGQHGGYAVSPYAPFVQFRLDQLNQQMTVDVSSNMLFEDQIGARPGLFDYNSSSPNPMAYVEGWLEHTRSYGDTLLMTELGFDRLAETEVGFHGSVLLPEHLGYTTDWWGTDTWHLYPIAPIMARDKALFYQHDLACETFTVDKPTLTWNLAFGYMLSYDLCESLFGGGLDSDWLGLVGAFQKHVLARYADEQMVSFADMAENVTQTSFETFTVIANWDEVSDHRVGRHTLPPLGSIVMNEDGSLKAGVFVAYNDRSLSPVDHYLIEERRVADVIVRQPIGADTSLTIDLLSEWRQNDPIEAWAYLDTGEAIGRVPVTLTPDDFIFAYRQQLIGQPADYYRLFKPTRIFLPQLAIP